MRNQLVASIIAMFVEGTNALAAHVPDDVEKFLSGHPECDKAGRQVLSDYRQHVMSTCNRDVTVDELQRFKKSPDYGFLKSFIYLVRDPGHPNYLKAFREIRCDGFVKVR